MLLDLGYQVVVVEVDENAHVGYSCENKRLMKLSKDVFHRPIVFIRFNPDAYTTTITAYHHCGQCLRDLPGRVVLLGEQQKRREHRQEVEGA